MSTTAACGTAPAENHAIILRVSRDRARTLANKRVSFALSASTKILPSVMSLRATSIATFTALLGVSSSQPIACARSNKPEHHQFCNVRYCTCDAKLQQWGLKSRVPSSPLESVESLHKKIITRQIRAHLCDKLCELVCYNHWHF